MNLHACVAMVTGGASGLGEAAARMVMAAGGRVIIVDRDQDRGQSLARELGDAALFAAADVCQPADIEAAIDAGIARHGALHALVHCAGVGGSRKVLEKNGPSDLEAFERVVRVNLIGTFNVIRLAAASMSQNAPNDEGERGVIVATASIAAYDGQIGQAAYSASKGGVVGMTLPIARELARHGIRVMTIAPGVFETPLLGQLPDEVRDTLGAAVPFPPRLGRPAEFAALARHIIENTMLNGEVIRLDGALRMPPK